MKFNDAISGAALLALAVAILLNVRTFPAIPGQSIGPAAFPALLAALLAGCSLPLIYRGLKDRTEGWVRAGDWLRSPSHVANFVVTIGVLLFYILLSNKLGFILCGVVVLGALFWKLRVNTALILPIALVTTLVIHTIFYKGLRVPLPWGVMLPMAW